MLEASPGLEVVEVGCPAEHETIADWSYPLPDEPGDPLREWDGQRFVHHVAAGAAYSPWRADGWEYRDTGIAEGTDGLAGVRVARPTGAAGASGWISHDTEFCLLVTLAGAVSFEAEGRPSVLLDDGGSVAVPRRHAVPPLPPHRRLPTPRRHPPRLTRSSGVRPEMNAGGRSIASPSVPISTPVAQAARGFAMGAADIVPGVSGGTVALVLGIYARLVHNVHLGAEALKAVVTGRMREFVPALKRVEWVWLLSHLAGVLAGRPRCCRRCSKTYSTTTRSGWPACSSAWSPVRSSSPGA